MIYYCICSVLELSFTIIDKYYKSIGPNPIVYYIDKPIQRSNYIHLIGRKIGDG